MKVVSARTLDEALSALATAGADTRIMAGGTDLMVEMESGRTRPDCIVDVWRVPELRGIRATDSVLEIGALTTCSDLMRDAKVHEFADILADSAGEVGAVQIQNRATIGGNLGTASPAADMNPALFVLGARVRLASKRGRRELPVESFVTGYRQTARAHDEIIEAVIVPRRPSDERRAFRKVGTRRAQSISKVVAAVAVRMRADGALESVRCAFGSIADRTLLLDETLALQLVQLWNSVPHPFAMRVLSLKMFAHNARDARDDVRSTAEYRREVCARITARMITDLMTAGMRP